MNYVVSKPPSLCHPCLASGYSAASKAHSAPAVQPKNPATTGMFFHFVRYSGSNKSALLSALASAYPELGVATLPVSIYLHIGILHCCDMLNIKNFFDPGCFADNHVIPQYCGIHR
jgi:hypothetical protein